MRQWRAVGLVPTLLFLFSRVIQSQQQGSVLADDGIRLQAAPDTMHTALTATSSSDPVGAVYALYTQPADGQLWNDWVFSLCVQLGEPGCRHPLVFDADGCLLSTTPEVSTQQLLVLTTWPVHRTATDSVMVPKVASATLTMETLRAGVSASLPGFVEPNMNLLYLIMQFNYNAPPLRKTKSCAVVGNGPVGGRRIGKIIDQHDAVLRLNDAPTQGYEEFVGTKTTHRVILNAYRSNTELIGLKHGYGQSENLIFIPHTEAPVDATKSAALLQQLASLRWLYLLLHPERDEIAANAKGTTLFLANASQTSFVNQTVHVINPEVLTALESVLHLRSSKVTKVVRGKTRNVEQTPSTGIVSIFLALQFCSTVRIVGFDTTIRGDGRYTRYFTLGLNGADKVSSMINGLQGGDMRAIHNSNHNVAKEHAFMKALVQSGQIELL